jgi:hypothetical protein
MTSLSGVIRRTTTALLAAGLAVPLLAGCGEKEEPPTTGPVVAQTTTGSVTTPNGGQNGGNGGQPATDEEKIKATVAAYLTRADAPGACTKLVTPQFVKRSYGNVKGCEAARKPSAMAKAVAFEPVDIGTSTTVAAMPHGGVFGGEKIEVTLINLDGQWTIDRISSNAKVGP